MSTPPRTDGARPVVVAVDGPSGSGKSTVSREVARRLGLSYLDTGAMYRALAWWCLDHDVDLHDQVATAAEGARLPLVLCTDPERTCVLLDGVDVSVQIRTSLVSERVSLVATNLAVREQMRVRQRELIGTDPAGTVAEGRDITTVVAPDADVRVLLTAAEGTRLARRARELHGRDDEEAIAATHDEVVRRDRDDSTVAQFAKAGEGVVTIDSSVLGFEQVVEAVLTLVEARTGRRPVLTS